MFREQLHESFDAISPSPELLDRISAMMSEEAARPKPAIRMAAVKYGGIAAALALAAGGTFFVMQNANSGIGTTNKPSAVAETVAAAGEAMDETDGAAIAAPAAYDAETTADFAAAEEAAEAEAYAANAVDADSDSFVAGAVEAEETEPVNQMKIMSDDNSILSVTTTAAATEAATAATTTLPSVRDNDAGSAQNGEVDNEEYDECADAEDSDYDKSDLCSDTLDAGGMTDSSNPATGLSSMSYEEPFIPEFCEIPKKLETAVGGVVMQTEGDLETSEKWRDYVNSFPPNEYANVYEYTADGDVIPTDANNPQSGCRDVTCIDDYVNVYSFIKYFDVPDDTVRGALKGKYTDEQIDILLSGDREKITAAFASEYAIVKGEKIYAPLWLDRHSFEEWEKAGITKEDIRGKYEKLINLPDYSEAILARLKSKLDDFLK